MSGTPVPPPGLVVPIRLEALLIGEADAANDDHFLPAYARFDSLPYRGGGFEVPYLSNVALSQPFTGAGPRRKGIHLHWNLPRALRRGAYDSAGNLTLPAVPDRWLVTRIVVDGRAADNPAVAFTSWVVESTFVAQDATYSETSIPQSPNGPTRPYAYLGRVYAYEDWLRNGNRGAYLDHLTAMGFGIPDFSSYYPNCTNVFGLFDESLDSAAFDPSCMQLAYAVTGWYHTPGADPVAGRRLDGSDNELGWRFAANEGVFPAYSLYHGVVYGVPWNPSPGYAFFRNFSDRLAPGVAVGNTPMEALSALVADRLAGEGLKNVERLLNAVQLGALNDIGQPGGLAKLEKTAFAKSFASVDGGALWDVRPAKATGTGHEQTPKAHPLADVPAEVADRLAALNAVQDTLEAKTAVAASLQAQIFADWYKFMVIQYAGNPSVYPALGDVYAFIQSEIEALGALTGPDGTIAGLRAEIAALQQEIGSQLPADAELVTIAAPRFYQPNDPVVLLSGDGVPLPALDDGSTLECVLTSGIPAAVALPDGLVAGSRAVTLPASALPWPGDASRLPYPVAAELVRAALLVAPTFASVGGAAIANLGGAANPAVLDFDATVTALSSAQTAYLGGTPPAIGIAFTGTPPEPAIAFRAWSTPWHPIAMSWRFDVAPLAGVAGPGETFPPGFVLDTFAFDPSSYDYRPRRDTGGTSIQEYSGTVLLSPDASLNLRNEISQYLQYVDDAELAQVLDHLGRLPVLAQALSGFGSSLLMLAETLQMPIADPIAQTEIYFDFSNTIVPMAVGDRNGTAPMTLNAYSPLRTGRATLAKVILIDEFGRYQDLDLSRLIVAESIPASTAGAVALMPPLRLAQHAQLRFRWLSAANPSIETSSLPGTNPICGWVVPNHLDSSLAFYDATGAAIGALRPADDGTSFVWQAAPGTGPPSLSMRDSFAGLNDVLSAFAFGVVANGPAYLSALIGTIDETMIFVGPQSYTQDSSTAVLLGAPLAIVQARLDLRLRGLPAPDQSFAALQADIDRGDPLSRSTRGFTGIEWPVLLGSLSELSDGLVGFFMRDGPPTEPRTDFSRFYALAADGSNAHIVAPEAGTLTLSLDGPPKVVTLLVDPRCDIHASTGLTPVKSLDIPADLRAGALERMSFTFLTSPVLRTPGRFELPVPSEAKGRWTWVAYGAGAWHETALTPVNPTAAMLAPDRIAEGWLKLRRSRKRNDRDQTQPP